MRRDDHVILSCEHLLPTVLRLRFLVGSYTEKLTHCQGFIGCLLKHASRVLDMPQLRDASGTTAEGALWQHTTNVCAENVKLFYMQRTTD
jgi:hypothetical protein